ncbi:MAG: methyltransferase domain-containing protein, partial [Verrucomicrobiae bacterium]|nr:methyltransferase domain-containing protein [Verrucomicrobiae bacterium]
VVIELGSGTGAVTRALLERGLEQSQVLAIEKSARLAALLRGKFPDLRVVVGDAWDLDALVQKHVPHMQVGAVVSSLPLRNFSRERRLALAQKIGSVLGPGGRWIQFSYHLHSLQPPATGCFKLAAWEIVWRNVPPARVNVYEKVGQPA